MNSEYSYVSQRSEANRSNNSLQSDDMEEEEEEEEVLNGNIDIEEVDTSEASSGKEDVSSNNDMMVENDCNSEDCNSEKIENIRKQFVPLDNLFWFLEHERIHISKSRFVDEFS